MNKLKINFLNFLCTFVENKQYCNYVAINSFFNSIFNDDLLCIVGVALDWSNQDRQKVGIQSKLFDTVLVMV